MPHTDPVDCRQDRYSSEQVIYAERAWFPPPRSPPRPGLGIRVPGVAALARAAFSPRRGRPRPGAAALALARSAPPRPSEPRCATRGGLDRSYG